MSWMPRKPLRSQEEIEKMKRELDLLRIIRIDGDPKLSIETQERIAELERELRGIPSWSSSKGFIFKNATQSEYGDNLHVIHNFSQTSKGKNSSHAEKIEALGELKTVGLKKRLSAGAGKSPLKKVLKSR